MFYVQRVLTHHVFDGQLTAVTQQPPQVARLWSPVTQPQHDEFTGLPTEGSLTGTEHLKK